MKKILFASAEAIPFIKTGGLADVVGSLPKHFPRKEYDVRVVIPKYLCMDQSFAQELEPVAECQVALNWRLQYAGVYTLVRDGVTFYFIDNEYYFAGPAPYGDIYQDAEKFAYFSKAVLTILPIVDFCPDVIHCNDWHTGLIPVFLAAFYRQDPFYRYMRTVFTIHNLKFQGRWYIDAVRDATGLPQHYFTMDTLESYGQANLLKGGVVFADYVTTVSETYAREIQTTDGGEGLDGLFRMKSYRLLGILNGLDYSVQDPATDARIAYRYEGDFAAYKKANKADLQAQLGLEENEDAFLIGMVSRLTDQKGLDLVDYIFDEIMGEKRIQFVVLGTGERRYEDLFRFFEGKYKGRVSANICYSDDLAQKIYASCDALLVPSLFEPCGLTQLIGMRYGTVPMVRETGGLKETVEAYNEFEHTGNGFSFHNYNAHEMLYMVRYAQKIFTQYPEEWADIVKRGMEADFSWDTSCKKYMVLYDSLIGEAAEQRAADAKVEEEAARVEEERKKEELRLRMRIEKEILEAKEAEERAKVERAAAEEKEKQEKAAKKTAAQSKSAVEKKLASKAAEKKPAAKAADNAPAAKATAKKQAEPAAKETVENQ